MDAEQSQPLLSRGTTSEILGEIKVFPLIPSLKRDVEVSVWPVVLSNEQRTHMASRLSLEGHWCVSVHLIPSCLSHRPFSRLCLDVGVSLETFHDLRAQPELTSAS